MPVPSGLTRGVLPLEIEELERVLKERLAELAHEHHKKLQRTLEQSRGEVLKTVSECLAKACNEEAPRGSESSGVAVLPVIEEQEQDLEVRDAFDPNDFEVMEAMEQNVGKVNSQNFMAWLRLKLAKIEHGVLDVLVSILIALNTVVMMLSHQQMGHDAARVLGVYDSTMDWLTLSQGTITNLEQAFAVIFFVELLARVVIHRMRYFGTLLNLFDAFLVVIGLVDMFILQPMMDSGGVNLVILRFLRIIKLARTLRVVRSMRLFTGLRVLVAAVSSFLPSLFWSMCFLGIFILLGGLLIGTSLIDFIEDESQNLEFRTWVWQRYGTSYRATYTMFQVTFAGCWPSYVNPLFDNVSQWYALFFIIYVTFVVFAVMRVITAIFLKETLDAAGEDHEVVMSEKEATKKKYMRKLAKIFHDMDVSGDGLISEDEFSNMLEDDNVKKYLAFLEVDLNESHSLFQMMADEDGQVSYTRFMDGMNRAKGLAKAADVLCIRHDLEKLRKDMKWLKVVSEKSLSEVDLGASCRRGEALMTPMKTK